MEKEASGDPCGQIRTGDAGDYQRGANLANFGPLDIIHDQVERKLESQIRHYNSLDTKVGLVIGVAALILTNTDLPRSLLGKICMITSIGGFLTGLMSLQVRILRNDPNPKRLADAYLQHTAEEIKAQLISNKVESFECNAHVLKQKAKWLRMAINLVVVSIILYLGVLYA